MGNKETVLVGMSGGVDSSVAAALCRRDGREVVGVTMRIAGAPAGAAVPKRRPARGCLSRDEEAEIEEARAVARILDLEHRVVDLREPYREIVLADFAREYRAGRTPNPCVLCNARIKFDLLLQAVRRSGLSFDRFATGHYVRLERRPEAGRFLLRRAADRRKDQSYFLYRLKQEQLSLCLFPLGGKRKEEVRALARELELPPADARESQDYSSWDYSAFIGGPLEPGPIVNRRGEVLGTHQGIARYTIGQRRGLGIASNEPLYVAAIEARTNTITVDRKEGLLRSSCRCRDTNWVSIPLIRDPLEVQAMIRSQHRAAAARISPGGKGRLEVRFYEPQEAVTPGQSVVFYQDDLLLSGGIIELE